MRTKKLSKSQLTNILLNQTASKTGKSVAKARSDLRVKKPVPTAPRKNVKQMVREYEENIILPPLQFRDDYKPKKPIALPRTEIMKTKQALKGYTESYEISIKNYRDPLIRLQSTRLAVKKILENILLKMKGFKYVETLEVTFEKMSNNDIINKTAYFNS